MNKPRNLHCWTRDQLRELYSWSKDVLQAYEKRGLPKVGRHRSARFCPEEVDRWLVDQRPRSAAAGLEALANRLERELKAA